MTIYFLIGKAETPCIVQNEEGENVTCRGDTINPFKILVLKLEWKRLDGGVQV
jgi:hypothetical protein